MSGRKLVALILASVVAALLVSVLLAWRAGVLGAREGLVAGATRAASAEGVGIDVAWTARWRLAQAASREQLRELRRAGPPDVVRREADLVLKALVLERSASALAAPGWPGEAAERLRLRLEELGIDGRVEVTPPPATGASAASPRDPRWPVVIVGVDGLDWQLADPLLAAGRLPHLAALIARGARGDLRSEEPMLSPLLWTTMATGRLPEDHGVLDFLAVTPEGRPVPITSDFRRVPALWDMADAAGLPSVFVGWWATWPAAPVRGAMVSDRLAYTALEGVEARVPERVAHPKSIADEVVPMAVRADDVPGELLARFVPDLSSRADDERVRHLRRMLAGALTWHRVALALVGRERPAVAGVYYELVDQVGHRFMHLAPPRRSGVSERDFASFSRCVETAYVVQDEWLGELLAKLPQDAVVLVLSDHGFLNGAQRPPGTADVSGRPGRWHREVGALVAAGGPVAPGSRLEGATVRDVAPTALHLMGLPVGEDMPGRVLFDGGAEVRRVPTWSDLARARSSGPASSDASLDSAAVEQLAALGYVGADGASPAAPRAGETAATGGLGTTASWHLNRAACLERRGRFEEAADEARAALERHALPEAHLVLARAARRRGDSAAALASAQAAAALPGAEAPARLTLADLLVAAGRAEEAEALLREVAAAEPGHAGAHARLASALMLRGDLAGALREAETVRAANPSSADSWVLAASVFGRAERPKDALACILRAKELGADDAGTYLVEALARAQLGDETRAREVVREGLAKHPSDSMLRELGEALGN